LSIYAATLSSLVALAASGQVKVTEEPSRPFLESHQGRWEGKADVIDHKRVWKGATLVCYAVESYPKNGDDGRACHLRFADHTEQTLRFKESIQVSSEQEVFLDCLGDKPTDCRVGTLYQKQAGR
jgi:hypothetical protein